MPSDLKLTLNPKHISDSEDEDSDEEDGGNPFQRDEKNIDEQFIDIQTKLIEMGRASADQASKQEIAEVDEQHNPDFYRKYRGGKSGAETASFDVRKTNRAATDHVNEPDPE